MSSIIEVKNLGKKYNIGERQGYVALRDVLTNIAKSPAKWFGEKVKLAAEVKNDSEFWALKDINFNVEQGEVLGIIGRNGAGKSTLLKILSQITPPTTGEIRLRGMVGSLLEVGTGFHPELTGRENIFLNGAILGMRKKEIERKFDEIVDFAGIGKFLDTPVKRYSSGMYVRLAFSVAAHLEPDILIIDEVLAVGDSEFQKKCLGKMDEVTKKEGRTILFVSHNMGAIKNLCKKCILLEQGEIKKVGTTEDVIENYLNNTFNTQPVFEYSKIKDNQIDRISILDKNKKPLNRLFVDEDSYIEIDYTFQEIKKEIALTVKFFTEGELLLMSSDTDATGQLKEYSQGKYRTTIKIPPYLFGPGFYYFDVVLQRPYLEGVDSKRQISFEILDSVNNHRSKIFSSSKHGKISSILNFQTIKE